ncbi:MAG: VOC family protein [Clostridiales bacterium]|nr:VOC family protein [Clostridiales bacterium]
MKFASCISLITENVDAEYERLKSFHMNIEYVAVPTTYPWGARSMHFRDPDGNTVCFVKQLQSREG